MRSSSIYAFALSVVGISAVAIGQQTSQPGCVSKCWANSQYVTNCAGNQKCLCDDAEFQNAMYQCLYSQCQTAQFGVALHHALALCSEEQAPAYTSSTPGAQRQGGDLRKRQNVLQSNSVTYTRTSTRAGGTVTIETVTSATPAVGTSGRASSSTATRGSASVSASAYMTYSTSRAAPAASSVLSVGPSVVTVVNSVTYTAPAVSSLSSVVSAPASSAAPSVVIVTVTASEPATTSSASSGPAIVTVNATDSSSDAVSSATPLATVSQIADGQVQVQARQAWDAQRYPSDS